MESLVDFLLNFYGPLPYWFLFGILLLCGFGLPIPEDVILFAAGLLAYYGVTDLTFTIVICFLGVMVGDSAMYFLGYKYGKKITQKGILKRLLPEERLESAREQFKNKGSGKILFAARFMPGLRAPLFFSAGVLHVPYYRFFLSDGLAALISVPSIIFAIYYLGDRLGAVLKVIKKIEGGIVGLIVVIAVGYFLMKKFKKKLHSNKG